MPRGWATAPVIGTGTEEDPYRPSVADREGVEGDRLEFVIDAEKSDTCLVGYDVADDSDFAKLGGEKLLVEADLDKAADRVTEADSLDALARESKVGRSGSGRDVLRRIGQTITPAFDERLHLGSREAPPTGSFGVDSFTGADESLLSGHTPDIGEGWTVETGTPKILGNRLGIKSSAAERETFKTLPAGPDYDVSVDLYTKKIGSIDPAGPCLRMINSQNRYGARCLSIPSGPTYEYQLYKIIAGGETVLGKVATSAFTPETTYPLVLSARGGSLAFYVKGAEVLSTTDSAITEAGKAGLTRGSGLVTHEWQFDNFTATNAKGVPVDLAAALSGTGSAAGTLTALSSLSASLSGSGSLSAELRSLSSLAASLSGNGSLSAGLTALASMASNLAGTGSLSGELGALSSLSSNLSGNGSLSAALTALADMAANLEGQGVVGAELTALVSLEAGLSGSGGLDASLGTVASLAADLSGQATLAAELSALVSLLAEIEGKGEVSAELTPIAVFAAILTATGSLTAAFEAAALQAAHLTLEAQAKTAVSLEATVQTDVTLSAHPQTSLTLEATTP